jgi:hypothetical protein
MTALGVRLHAGDPPAGLEALAGLPDGTFFQTSGWLRAVHRAEPRLEPVVIVAEDSGGTLRAACPMFRAAQWGVWRFYAGAWGTYGGIVAHDANAADAVRGFLDALGHKPRVALMRVHDFASTLGDSMQWSRVEETCQVLDLPDDPEALFHGAFTSQNRNKIRKAEKLGVVVRRTRDAESLERYAALYAESAARWGLQQPLPAVFFAALAGVPGVDVWLAEMDGETIAGLLNFTCGGQVMNWGNVSRRDRWGASPNNLLHWRALEAACGDPRGPRLYNFGGSTGLPGVETFKTAFGAQARHYPRREHSAAWLRLLGRRGRNTAPAPRQSRDVAS